MKKLLLGGLLALSSLSFAQNTTLSATVVDSDGTVWANGTWSVQFNPNSAQPNFNIYNINGTPLDPTVTQQKGTLTSAGVLAATVYQNDIIAPSGSTWTLTVCPNASSLCGSYQFSTGTSSSMDVSFALTAAIPAAHFKALAGSYGYNNNGAIVTIPVGATYWNVSTKTQRYNTGTGWVDGLTSTNGQAYPTYTITSAPYNAATTLADNGPAINRAIAAAQSSHGGTLLIPGVFTYSTPINLSATSNITFKCASDSRSVSGSGCELHCTRTDAVSCVNATGSGGLTISGVNFIADSTSYTGYELDISGLSSTGYSAGAVTTTTTGSGTGAAISVSSLSGSKITGLTVSNGGTNYALNDLLYLTQGSVTGAVATVSSVSSGVIIGVTIINVDTSDFRMGDSRISGPVGTTATYGICINCHNTGGVSDTSAEHIYIGQNFFISLASGIVGPSAGSAVHNNDTHLQGNWYNGPFATYAVQPGAGSWYITDGNVFEPKNGAGGIQQAIKSTAVSPNLTVVKDNWIGDGANVNPDSTSVPLDFSSASGGSQLHEVQIVGNVASGFYTFYKGNANVLWVDMENNDVTGCTNLVDRNNDVFFGIANSPGYTTCTYPVVNVAAGTNYPTVAQTGQFTTRGYTAGYGQATFENYTNLFQNTTLIGNGFIGHTFGGFNYNVAFRPWYNGFPMPIASLSSPVDPDYGGNAYGTAMDIRKLCSTIGTTNVAGHTCLYFDAAGALHFRSQILTTSITFTSGSTSATVVGPTTGLTVCIAASPCIISDANVPAGTTATYSAGVLTLSVAATGTTTTGSSISLTGCTYSPTSGQVTFTNSGTNGLSAVQTVYITNFTPNCTTFNGRLLQTAYEGLGTNTFNAFTQVTGSGTWTESGTALQVPIPSTISVDNTIWIPRTDNTLQLNGKMDTHYINKATSGTVSVLSPLHVLTGSWWNGASAVDCGIYRLTNIGAGTYQDYHDIVGCSGMTGAGTRFVPGPIAIPNAGGFILAIDPANQTANRTWATANWTGTLAPYSLRGTVTLVLGTATISNVVVCALSSTCQYKLTNCGANASTAIGVPSIGTISAGTSFIINSLSATNTVVTGDVSTICWQIN